VDYDDSGERGAYACKHYRLDLFLSVDVAGSTAFKFSNSLSGGAQQNGDAPNGWFTTIKKFYITFHQTFLSSIEQAVGNERNCVELWKALGDELIYRVTVSDMHVIARIVMSFIDTVHSTRKVVRGQSKSLDLKASAWLVDFPARNAIIDFDGLRDGGLTEDEDHDQNVNHSTHRPFRDFIGPSIDAGFRLGKVATRSKMALSVELALILSKAQSHKRCYPFIFGYDGREDMKGVLGGDGYPVVWLDIEDNDLQRETNRREAAMLQRRPEVPSDVVVDFCLRFILSSYWMEEPFLGKNAGEPFNKIPPSHLEHARRCLAVERNELNLYRETDQQDQASEGDIEISSDKLLSQFIQQSSGKLPIDLINVKDECDKTAGDG
jgi:hypothetical protein